MRTLTADEQPRRRGLRLDLTAFGRALATLRTGRPAPAGPDVYVPPALGPVNRWWLRRPKDVDLDSGVGTWCPMCDGLLSLAVDGWRCMAPSCWALWDVQGRRGRWVGGEGR